MENKKEYRRQEVGGRRDGLVLKDHYSSAKLKFILILITLLSPTSYLLPPTSIPLALAQGVAVEAFVDKPTVLLDDQFILTVRVKGANVFTEPRIPSRGNFDVLSRGSASNIEMINGRLTVMKEYTYILGPKKEGTFDIGPVSVEVEGVEYKAGPLSVTVTAGEGSPGPAPQGRRPSPFPGLPPMPGFPQFPSPSATPIPAPSGTGQYRDVFVTAEVDNKNPYVGEQLIYTFRLFTSRNINNAKLDLPNFHSFWNEEVQKENKYYKELGGTRYVVSEYRVALFPSQAGTLTVGETVLKAHVEQESDYSNLFNDPFFTFRGRGLGDYRPRVFKAPAIAIEVKPLPPGAPSDFKGLVGQFKLDSNLSKKDLTVGETATLSYTISGTGNIKDATLNLRLEIPNLKIYEDKPSVDLKKNPTGVSGTKTFNLALVPEAPGQIQIPPVTLSYFDPKQETYQALTSASSLLSVVPGAQEKMTKVAAQPSIQPGTPVNPLAEDIATIHHRDVKLIHEEPSFEFFYVILVLFAAPPMILVIAALVLRRQRWKDANLDIVKKRRALSKAMGQLRELDLKTTREIPTQISHVLKEYLGDKLGMVGTALTPREVEAIFSKNGKKSEAGLQLARFLQQLDDWQYGGLPQEKGWEGQTRKKAMGILKSVEREF